MENDYKTREEASAAAAQHIAKLVSARLNGQGEAALVVSGGTTPARCYAELSETALDWEHVHVLLSDERWVPPNDEASNERLVRENLLQKFAAEARLLSYYEAGESIEDRCTEIDALIRTLPIPFACSLVGMGEDGHFASLFPDAPDLDAALDRDNTTLCRAVTTAASPHARVSLTLAALSRSDEIVLLIFGAAKRKVYEAAKTSGNTYPVAHLIKQKRAPVRVFWAP